VLLDVVIPLWLVEETDAPRVRPARLFGTDTVMAVLLQVAAARGVDSVDRSLRAARLSAGFVVLACLIVLVTHDTPGWLTIFLVWLGHATVTGPELFQSAGSRGFQSDLSDPERRGEYQGASQLGHTVRSVWATAACTYLAMESGCPGLAGDRRDRGDRHPRHAPVRPRGRAPPASGPATPACLNPRMASPAQWLAGSRPRTLPAAVSPVLAGTGVAAYVDSAVWWKALLALVVSLALQVAVNYANDYSDGIRGTDDARVGPMRLVGSGAATPAAVKRAAFLAFGVAGIAGLVLAATTAWWLVAVGLVSGVAAWFYTGGKKPYGYLGLGEVMVFVFFGLVAVLGTTYVQTETFEWPALYAAIGIGALTCGILVVNNLRDIPTDTVAGKRTLAVLMGDGRTRALYLLLVLAAAAAVVAVAVSTTWWALVGLGFLLVAVRGVRTVLGGATGPGLIPVLQQTGVAELLWAALVVAALVARR
jgi:1,4-dihydroxy-2-naphthoate octaprenyltransferase